MIEANLKYLKSISPERAINLKLAAIPYICTNELHSFLIEKYSSFNDSTIVDYNISYLVTHITESEWKFRQREFYSTYENEFNNNIYVHRDVYEYYNNLAETIINKNSYKYRLYNFVKAYHATKFNKELAIEIIIDLYEVALEKNSSDLHALNNLIDSSFLNISNLDNKKILLTLKNTKIE